MRHRTMNVSCVLSIYYCALIMGAYIIICSCFYRNDKINLFCIRSFPIFVEYKIRPSKESFDGIYCLDFSRVRTECIYVEL